jgi:hypothetical protein
MRSRFAETDLAAMERVMRVNFNGTLYTTYHALPPIKATRGSLVAITSLVAEAWHADLCLIRCESVRGAGVGMRRCVWNPHPTAVPCGNCRAQGMSSTPSRANVLGPSGKPWPTPPTAPFRVWPLDLVVEKVIQLIEKRKSEVILPGVVGPLLALDHLIGTWLVDRWLSRRGGPRPIAQRWRESGRANEASRLGSHSARHPRAAIVALRSGSVVFLP